jgi:acetate kinase
MKILVINAGSSSLKYQLIDMIEEKVLAKGNCERIGLEEGIFTHKTFDGREQVKNVVMNDHTAAFTQVKNALTDTEYGVVKSLTEVSAVGHRIVQGGSLFSESVLVDDEVIAGIESLIPLAPLHNSAHVQGIRACRDVLGEEVPEVVVFDTAFHSTMPQKAYMFNIPYEYYEKYGIRRYGFHGTSHRYVSQRCAELMGKDIKGTKIVTCHLGNGSSITAVDGGKVIDTSMGLTPLDGFMMGTRTGTLDPSVVTFIMEKEGLTPHEMDDLMNKKSGMLGLSGISSDDREITAAAKAGEPRAVLTHEILEYQISKYIAGYMTALGGCDAIVFTAGLGENQAHHREKIGEAFAYMGVEIDKKLNKEMVFGKEGKISTENSSIEVYVIPTNEELVIARDTKSIVEKL